MSIPRSTRAVLAAATVAALSACSGGSQFSPGAGQQSVPQQSEAKQFPSLGALGIEAKTKKPTPLIFAADQGGQGVPGAVYAYINSGKGQSPVWSLTSGLKEPAALWVDGSGNLWVGDASGFIYEYATPTSAGPPGKPIATYSNNGLSMNHIAVCGDYVYASDPSIGSNETAGFTVWKTGTEKPVTTVLASVQASLAGGITCNDKTGDVYFMYNTSYFGPATLYQYGAGGTGNGTQLFPSPQFDSGLTFNQAYTLLVLGDNFNSAGPSVEFWKTTGKKPTRTFVNPPHTFIGNPVGFAYEKGDGELWDADAGNKALYRFKPGNATLENTITSTGGGNVFKNLSDVAASPADHT